jgi:hypothetical protein
VSFLSLSFSWITAADSSWAKPTHATTLPELMIRSSVFWLFQEVGGEETSPPGLPAKEFSDPSHIGERPSIWEVDLAVSEHP